MAEAPRRRAAPRSHRVQRQSHRRIRQFVPGTDLHHDQRPDRRVRLRQVARRDLGRPVPAAHVRRDGQPEDPAGLQRGRGADGRRAVGGPAPESSDPRAGVGHEAAHTGRAGQERQGRARGPALPQPGLASPHRLGGQPLPAAGERRHRKRAPCRRVRRVATPATPSQGPGIRVDEAGRRRGAVEHRRHLQRPRRHARPHRRSRGAAAIPARGSGFRNDRGGYSAGCAPPRRLLPLARGWRPGRSGTATWR